MSEDYSEFAVETAKTVAREEAKNMMPGMAEDINSLTERWVLQFGERIQQRMHDLGIPQELAIELIWAPGAPEFHVHGSTYTGGIDGEKSE